MTQTGSIPSDRGRWRWLLPALSLALILGVLAGRRVPLWPPFAMAAGILILAAALLRKRRRAAWACLCAAVLSAGIGLSAAAWHPALPRAGTYHITAVVAEELRDGARTQHKTTLRDVRIDGVPFPQGAYWSFYSAELPEGLTPGCAIEADLRLYHPSGADNPGGYDWRASLMQHGVTIGLYGRDNLTVSAGPRGVWGLAAAIRHACSERLIAVMGEETGGLASAMLLGTRNLVPDEDRTAFRRLGIAHILSVSGFHVAVLAGLLMSLLNRLKAPKRVQYPCVLAVLLAYMVLTGMNAPVMRASILWALAGWAEIRGRERPMLHLLCEAAALTLLINPTQLFDAGFQLSYSAMLGLTMVQPTLQKMYRPKRRMAQALWQRLCQAAGVQAGILLPTLFWYQELPVLGLAFNLVVLAAANWLLMAYWAMLALMWLPGIGPAAGTALRFATELLTGGARWIAEREWLTLWTRQANLWTAIACLAMLLALCRLIPLKKRQRLLASLAAFVLAALTVVPWPGRGTEYIQFSVGSADAALLRDDSTVTVIDTGEEGIELSGYLHRQRLSVDTLILTHLHRDHAGGIQALLDDRIPVRRVVLPAGAFDAKTDSGMAELVRQLTDRGAELVTMSRGDVLPLPHGVLVAAWPAADALPKGVDANDSCLVLQAALYGTTLLLTGDLSGAQEMNAVMPADILKVAHHGSKNSTSAAFLQAVDPKALIVPGGSDSNLQHIRRQAGILPVYATEKCGAVIVRIREDGYTIQTWLNSEGA